MASPHTLVRTALIIPTRNAGPHLDLLLPALAAQTLQPDQWLVVDSQSSDDTVARCRQAGARVVDVVVNEFNHGGTRRMAAGLVDADVLIYMTQDAIPATADSLQRLRDAVLSDERIGVAYGRQLAHPGASLLAAHARAFNYPDSSRTKRREDAGELGIKTCFSSDSFCAYRRSALQAVGGFPVDVIGTEDAYVAGRMLLEGWDVRYEAGSQVFHSHDYTMPQEFSRYFDIGVFYGREQWINRQFGGAGKEGGRFIHSEIDAAYAAGKFWLIPEILLRSTLKWCGYRLGRAEAWLPRSFKRQVSMFSAYWN